MKARFIYGITVIGLSSLMITTTCGSSVFGNDKMNNKTLETLIEKEGEIESGQPGFWEIKSGQRIVYVVTDERANRMRIMTAVIKSEKLKSKDMRQLLSANFDRSLDARYALSKGVLWSAFLHPLESLTESDFQSAFRQVKTLADNFGGSYMSGELIFQGDVTPK